jgi:hypothetical protein
VVSVTYEKRPRSDAPDEVFPLQPTRGPASNATGIRPGANEPALAGMGPTEEAQYTGMLSSTVLAQAVMPPPRCLAVENPDCLSRARASAERTPDLQ